MTTEDQDAVVGRLVRERRDLREKQQALFASANHMAELLKRLGEALGSLGSVPRSRHPIQIGPRGITIGPVSMTASTTQGTLPTVDEITQLLGELEDVETKLGTIDNQMKIFGI